MKRADALFMVGISTVVAFFIGRWSYIDRSCGHDMKPTERIEYVGPGSPVWIWKCSKCDERWTQSFEQSKFNREVAKHLFR